MPTLKTKLITEALPVQPTKTGEPGRYLLRIIDAGEGSSAIYPPEALKQAVGFGMSPLGQTARSNATSASSVHVAEALPEKKADDGRNGPIYP